LVENQFDRKIKIFRSNGGGEFTSTAFKKFLGDNGIHHQITYPYTPKQNGIVERKYRHIIETSLALLNYSCLPNTF
jgi:transposase InsO family protein